MTISIDHLDCHYTVPRQDASAVRARLDRLATTALPAALQNRVEPLPGDDGSFCFIERLEIDTPLGGATAEQQIADRWADSLWSALAKRIRNGDGVTIFANRSDYVASFLLDLLASPYDPRWYFAPLFAATAGMSVPAGAAHALLEDPDAGRDALIAIHQHGRLHELLQLLGDDHLDEIVHRCLLPASPEVVFGTTVKRWVDAIRSVRAAARFVPTGHASHDTIVLYLETLAARPDLGPDVNLARFIVRLLDLVPACNTIDGLADALRNGDFAAARPLLKSPDQVRFVGSLLQAVTPREIVALIDAVQPDAAGATERTLHTAYAGVFLLASSVIALDLSETLPPLPFFLAIARSLGENDAAINDAGVAAFAGLSAPPSPASLARALAGISLTLTGKAGTLSNREPFSPAGFGGGEGADRRMRGRFTRSSLAHVCRSHLSGRRPPHPPSAPSPPAKNRGGRRTLDKRAWQRIQADRKRVADAESEIQAISTSLLQHFAGRLGAFRDSGAAYLQSNFLRGHGVVTVSEHRLTVRFLTCPMRVVLRMTGFAAPLAMPWNENRRLELEL
jgi:hypothetical protein